MRFNLVLRKQRTITIKTLLHEREKMRKRHVSFDVHSTKTMNSILTMGLCRVFCLRPKKKTFQIFLLLIAFAAVSFWVRVQYESTLKTGMKIYANPKEAATPPDDQALVPDMVFARFTTEHGDLFKEEDYAGNPVDHTMTHVSLEDAIDSAKEENAPARTTAIIFVTSGSLDTNRGFLNHHVWENVCSFRVESLRELILFPNAPSRRRFSASFKTKETSRNFGERIFGFIHPDISGAYRFAVSSDDNSDLCLSSDENSENVRKIANVGSWNESSSTMPGQYSQLSPQVSSYVNLTKGSKYFIELLHKQNNGISHAEVAWQKPGESDFEIITSEYISAFVDDRQVPDNAVTIDDYTESTSRSRDTVYVMPTVDREELEAVLPTCAYEPTYLIKHKLARFQGARNKNNTHFAAVYPEDTTNETLPLVQGDDIWWQENNLGNVLVDEETASRVVRWFMQSLEQRNPGVYNLEKISSVEEVKDSSKGWRYLVDLILTNKQTGTDLRFSDFVYAVNQADDNPICFPEGFRWHKRAVVNIIVPVKDAGRWAMSLVRNIAEVLQESHDKNVRVIIIDYESQDVDIESVLRESSISDYTVLKIPREQMFRRSKALQLGADAVKDPHSILFLCDLHLSIPPQLIDLIRKHCIEGKMAFAPVVKRLRCGYYPKLPVGYWETLGFGLFALYKSDFDRVGGINERKYSGWGGEDWDLLDRVLMSRMEVERLKIARFYHFYHPSLNGNNQRVGA